MNDNQVLAELLGYVREISERDVDAESALMEGGFIDSFSILQIVNFIEEQFGVTIDANNLPIEEFENVRKLTDWVRQLRVAA